MLHMARQVEVEYRLFLMIDLSSYRSQPTFSGGCVKFYPLAFFKSKMAATIHKYHTNGHNSPTIGARDTIFGSIHRFLCPMNLLDGLLL